jgi:hypothetical protein
MAFTSRLKVSPSKQNPIASATWVLSTEERPIQANPSLPPKNAFSDDIIQSILESSVTSTYKLLSENRSSSVPG